jgi:vacuolar-type H+-ATPase subunit I/STV1
MSIVTALAPYKLAAEIMVFGALASGVAFGIHEFLEHERDVGRAEVQALWDKQITADKEAARMRTDQMAAQVTAATTNGAKRDETIQALAATVAASSGSLRDAIAKVNGGVPGLSADSLRALAGTYGQLLAECQGRRAEVAGEAERLNSEKRTLIEAWPSPAAKQQ